MGASLGLAGVHLGFARTGTDIGFWTVAAPLLVCGVGMGMILAPLFDIIMRPPTGLRMRRPRRRRPDPGDPGIDRAGVRLRVPATTEGPVTPPRVRDRDCGRISDRT
jgi:hypothetical protein